MKNSRFARIGSFLFCAMDIEQLHNCFLQSRHVTIDSRNCPPGAIFFALQGNADGNRFAADALANGAEYAVVDHQKWVLDDRYILVEDSLLALQKLAQIHRRYLGIPILALTGSNGKTTTKELIARVLGTTYRVYATPGNYNNHIGVPLTLLGIPDDTEMAVVEMGANAQGEIAGLCAIAEPQFGLITNIGKAHLDGFGGEEGVKKGKSELYRYIMAHQGLIFYNRDEAHLADLVGDYQPAVVYSAETAEADMQYVLDREDTRIQLHYYTGQDRIVSVKSSLFGVHNFRNILAAITIGRHFGVSDSLICSAISQYVPDNNRSQLIVSRTNTWIMDAYNANPSSMVMALRSLNLNEGQARMAILGDMFELGADSQKEHQAIIDLLITMDTIEPILVGVAFQATNHPDHWPTLATARDLAIWLDKRNPSNMTILVKGSRGIALEKGVQGWISENETELA